MMQALEYIHLSCHQLCKQSMGKYLPVAGNIGIFCHQDDEFDFLKQLQSDLTDLTKYVYGKYYLLHTPIVIPQKDGIPEAIYKYLYIRKPDTNKPQVGDLDFYMASEKYAALKQSLQEGKVINGARILPNRPDLDLIELSNPNIDAVGFIGDKFWK